MSLIVSLKKLRERTVHFQGEVTIAEMDLPPNDELVRLGAPVSYDFEASVRGDAIILEGQVSTVADCDCARCLKPVKVDVEIDVWQATIPLEGEDAVSVLDDSVDLTPFLREDILLFFPQHPLCKSECKGLTFVDKRPAKKPDEPTGAGNGSAWTALDKLKF